MGHQTGASSEVGMDAEAAQSGECGAWHEQDAVLP